MMNYKTIYSHLNTKIQMLFSDNAVLSFPVPDIENGIMEDAFFVYYASFQNIKMRPHAIFKVAMKDETILLYQNCCVKDFINTMEHPFNDGVSYIPESVFVSVDDYTRKIDELLAIYGEVRKVAFKENLTDEEKSVVISYKKLLFEMTSEDAQVFYKALGNLFFKWVDQCLH